MTSAKEALLAEALGDLGLCLDRLEALKGSLPSEAEAASARIADAAEAAVRRVRDEIRHQGDKVASEHKALLTAIAVAAREAKLAAAVIEGKAWWFALRALAVGLCGGVVGGVVIVGLALK